MATANEIIENAKKNADDSLAYAEDLISSAQSYARGTTSVYGGPLNYTFGSIADIDIGDPLPYSGFLTPFIKPTFDGTDPTGKWKELSTPDEPIFPDRPTDLDFDSLFGHTPPTYAYEDFDGSFPTISYPDVPDEPDFLFPDDPTDLDVTVGAAPVVTIPEFTDTFDETLPTVPDDISADDYERIYKQALPEMRAHFDELVAYWINTYSPEYHDALARLEEQITEGSAYNEEFNQAQYEKAREKINAEYQRLEMEITTTMAGRGFALPPAAISTALQKAQYEIASNLAASATEVHIERVKLEQQHLQFVMQLSAQMRESMRNHAIQYAGLVAQAQKNAMEFAQQSLQFAKDIFQMQLDRYKAGADIFRIMAQVYETRLKAATYEWEIYKVELDAARTKADIKKIELQLYGEKLRGIEARINVYVQQLKALDTKANLEKFKIDVFSEEIKLYIAQLDAKKMQFDVYTAAMEGDAKKVDGYKAIISAYETQVGAEESKVKASSAFNDSKMNYNRNLTSLYEAQLAAWRAEIDAERTRHGADVDGYRAYLAGYQAQLEAQIKQLSADLEEEKMRFTALEVEYKGSLEARIADAKLDMEEIKLRADTAIAGANAAGNLAQAALKAQNTMITLVERVTT